MRVAKALRFGCVWVNDHIPLVSEMPHGGYKQSGYGKDLSMYSLEDYTEVKHVMINLGLGRQVRQGCSGSGHRRGLGVRFAPRRRRGRSPRPRRGSGGARVDGDDREQDQPAPRRR